MGQISNQLTSRFRGNRKLLRKLRKEFKDLRGEIPDSAGTFRRLVKSGHAPLHAIYITVQNHVSIFAEQVSILDEFASYYDIVAPAEDEYMPSGPPMSPLTTSYFTTWALFDVQFGPDQETVGTCFVDLSHDLGLDPFWAKAMRNLQESRMGIYEHAGASNTLVTLRELITDSEFVCYPASGFQGKEGQLWYTRLCPPVHGIADHHVVFTTPYVLIETSKSDWTAYLSKLLRQAQPSDSRPSLNATMKFGHTPRHWPEFIFQGYHHHQYDAIFLAGIPDVKGSLPHAS